MEMQVWAVDWKEVEAAGNRPCAMLHCMPLGRDGICIKACDSVGHADVSGKHPEGKTESGGMSKTAPTKERTVLRTECPGHDCLQGL